MKTIVALLLFISSAHASIIYNWTGDCTSGCAGQAHAVLTFENTYDGRAFDDVPVSRDPLLGLYTPLNGIYIFTEDDSRIFGIYNTRLTGLFYPLDLATGDMSSGVLDVLVNSDNRFQTFVDRTWTARFEQTIGSFWSFSGTNGVFIQAVPEPSTLLLLLPLLLACGHKLTRATVRYHNHAA